MVNPKVGQFFQPPVDLKAHYNLPLISASLKHRGEKTSQLTGSLKIKLTSEALILCKCNEDPNSSEDPIPILAKSYCLLPDEKFFYSVRESVIIPERPNVLDDFTLHLAFSSESRANLFLEQLLLLHNLLNRDSIRRSTSFAMISKLLLC
ncbi:hypothetical protein BT96DRAFT_1062636 [Gymnopus androsaceus JB14]|uniref:Uncharacterized protein n=1 Tax=Gymnopus androsaceus JB14 TaxID=1447944 RepID=A0A6A4I7X9_9AGAR|nr:hypothetical protein BT96DRAFT_1062636 [Gymnopus androsaceus JB14]